MGLSITYYLARLWYTLVLYWTKESTRFTLELLDIFYSMLTVRIPIKDKVLLSNSWISTTY